MATIRQRSLLFLSLTLISGGFAHATWEEIEQFEDGMRVYVLRESLQRDGEISYLDHLVRWPEPQTGDDHAPYRSTRVHTAYHCEQKLERYVSSRSFAGVMGDGSVVLEDTEEAQVWFRVSDSAMEGKLWRLACAPAALHQSPQTPPGGGKP